MVCSLQETSQTVDIELLPSFVIAYFQAFREQFGEMPQGRIQMNEVERVGLLCLARDNAEALVRERKGGPKLQVGGKKVWSGFAVPE